MRRTGTRARLVAAVAALVAVVAIGVALLTGDPYEIEAQFTNGGQLVEGGEVRMGGRVVGSIREVSLGRDAVARVRLRIDDEDAKPLREGTRAQIRAIGAAGINNRYVALLPGGARASTLPDGATLPPAQTDPIVDIDALIGAFTPEVRKDVSALMESSAEVYAGSGGKRWNAMLAKLRPSLRDIDGVLRDVASDQAQLARLVEQGERASSAVASRQGELVEAVTTSAQWLASLADRREDLARSLERAPALLQTTQDTLRRADTAVTRLRPVLPDITRTATPLTSMLRSATGVLPKAEPVVRDLRRQLPAVDRSLEGLVALERPLRSAFTSLAPAFKGLTPILDGFRTYSVDIALGVVNGLAGLVAGNFNAQGHYLHANITQSLQTLVTTPLADILSVQDLVPGILGARIGQTRTCPGGLAPPAPDGSSPIEERKDLCDTDQSLPAYVNDPPKLGGP